MRVLPQIPGLKAKPADKADKKDAVKPAFAGKAHPPKMRGELEKDAVVFSGKHK